MENLPIEIIDGDRGKNYPNHDEFSSVGHCLFLNTKNVPDYEFSFDDCYFINQEKDNMLRKGKLQRGDIIMTTRGTVGNTALYHENIPYENIRINSGMVIFRTTKKKIDNYYLYICLRSPFVKNQCKFMVTGSAQPQLPIRDIKKLKLFVPPLNEQLRLSSYFLSLDKQIHFLIKKNIILEKIIQSIFNSWFIDFDGETEFSDSELGKIPKGWSVSKIGSLVTKSGGTPSKNIQEFWEGGTIGWINSKKARDFRIIEPITYITEEAQQNSSTKLIPKKTTVLAITGATLGEVSFLEIDSCISQNVVAILGNEKIPSEFIYFWVRNNINELIRQQSGGAQQHINKKIVDECPLLIPDSNSLSRFYKISNKIFQNIAGNCFEIKKLKKIRELLFHNLLSGENQV